MPLLHVELEWLPRWYRPWLMDAAHELLRPIRRGPGSPLPSPLPLCPIQWEHVGHLPGQLEMACRAHRWLFVSYYRRRLLGATRTGPTLVGRLNRVQVVECRTSAPPLWLYLLEQHTTRMVLP